MLREINIFFILVSMMIKVTPCLGQWSTEPGINLQICNWALPPFSATTDSAGGIYIAVTKEYYDPNHPAEGQRHQYLFKIDKSGYLSWPAPIEIRGLGEWSDHIQLIPDNRGGVIAGFVDMVLIGKKETRPLWDYKVRVQKIDSDGNLLWGNGIQAIADTCDQPYFNIISDNDGGCFTSVIVDMKFQFDDSDDRSQILQHISLNGEQLWGEDGRLVADTVMDYYNCKPFQIILGQNDDIIVQSTRFNTNPREHLIRRFDLEGNLIWTIPTRFDWFDMNILPSKNDGIFIVGFKEMGNSNWILGIDRITSNGAFYWDSVQTVIDSVGTESGLTKSMLFNNENILIYWWNSEHVFIQKINFMGQSLFNGLGLLPHPYQSYGREMLLSEDNFIVTDGFFAQKFNSSGQPLWDEDGLYFSSTPRDMEIVISDMNGGFISTWEWNLNGVWAQQVSKNGKLGEVLTHINFDENTPIPNSIHLEQNFPNPFNNSTTIRFFTSCSGKAKIQIFDLAGNQTKVIEISVSSPGTYNLALLLSELPSGIYFYTLKFYDKNDRLITKTNTYKMVLLK